VIENLVAGKNGLAPASITMIMAKTRRHNKKKVLLGADIFRNKQKRPILLGKSADRVWPKIR